MSHGHRQSSVVKAECVEGDDPVSWRQLKLPASQVMSCVAISESHKNLWVSGSQHQEEEQHLSCLELGGAVRSTEMMNGEVHMV